jgi:hypothetical protein
MYWLTCHCEGIILQCLHFYNEKEATKDAVHQCLSDFLEPQTPEIQFVITFKLEYLLIKCKIIYWVNVKIYDETEIFVTVLTMKLTSEKPKVLNFKNVHTCGHVAEKHCCTSCWIIPVWFCQYTLFIPVALFLYPKKFVAKHFFQ